MNRRGWIGIFIFIFFIFLIVGGLFLYIWLYGKPHVNPVQSVINYSYYNVTFSSNAESKVDYSVLNGSQILRSGVMFPNVLEHYSSVRENLSIGFSAWSGEYYFSNVSCNITFNDFPCKTFLKKKALNYSVHLSINAVSFSGVNGSIQSPIILCWSFHSNIVDVSMALDRFAVPPDSSSLYDICYVYRQDISSSDALEYSVTPNPTYSVPNNLTLMVRDFEIGGHSNIGDKIATIFR